jgi:hypothetical protein
LGEPFAMMIVSDAGRLLMLVRVAMLVFSEFRRHLRVRLISIGVVLTGYIGVAAGLALVSF